MTDPKPRKVVLIGNPGAGRTLAARELTKTCRLWHGQDGQRLYAFRVAGLEPPTVMTAGIRAPHHSVSEAGLFGVLRDHQWRPGELALAHGGVLLLDEAPEFRVGTLERVARVWKARHISLMSRTSTLTVPAVFDLVMASNPCPCGWKGHSRQRCVCTDAQVERYLRPVRLAAGDDAEWMTLPEKPERIKHEPGCLRDGDCDCAAYQSLLVVRAVARGADR